MPRVLVEMEEDLDGLRSLDILCDLLGVSPDNSCGATEPALPPSKKKRSEEGETATATSGLDLLECSGGNAQDVPQSLPTECTATEKPESRSNPPVKEEIAKPSLSVSGASVAETREQASGSVCEPSSCSLQSKSGRACSSLDLFSSSEGENSTAPAVREPAYGIIHCLSVFDFKLFILCFSFLAIPSPKSFVWWQLTAVGTLEGLASVVASGKYLT